ncbi:RNA polymerase sigma factor [Singulisphaera rosea]
MVSRPIERDRTEARPAPTWDEAEELPDEQLLDRFLAGEKAGAEEAFRELVVRHGPMVLGVCRQILSQQQDAEDAFQATFLVLSLKANTIHDRRVLGRWLYEVAYRIAVRSKINVNRRRAFERQGAEMSVQAEDFEPGWSELRPVLHEEVNRLPEKYRAPVVLSYLEGKSNEEVARLLRWPVGTVKGRLSRARDLLRERLTRRGLVLSAAFLLTTLSRNMVFAEVVPSRLIDSTVVSAMRLSRRNRAYVSAATAEAIAYAEEGWWVRFVAETRRSVAFRAARVAIPLLILGGILWGATLIAMDASGMTFNPNSILPILDYGDDARSCHPTTPTTAP